MKQYLIIAHDGRDEEALQRRMTARPRHLEGAKQLKAAGHYVTGGAILDEQGTMKGSVMILAFETDEAFQEWYAQEPYITEGVWNSIEVKSFRVADV
ncbi:MAG: hypothetical protein FJX89_00450 [Bacteroidetes bacterium]|nr:hypothetical protein [Bacteroidota bacterium]